jgi:lipopolysaccharide/colanic/teichoic acid biosynthesis glycosyltransferase
MGATTHGGAGAGLGLRSRQHVKRLLDVCLAAVLLAGALPLLLIAAMAILLDSRGPVGFSQVRVGAEGRPFRLYKLRTMVLHNDDSEHTAYVAALIRGDAHVHDGMFKLVADLRVTRVGRLLRRYSVDELPQLWNVLRGDMSLVGPRPALPGEVALYDEPTRERLRGKPGLTGLAQVRGRCQLPFEEMVSLDIEYLRSSSLLLDLRILLMTPYVVLSCRGAA